MFIRLFLTNKDYYEDIHAHLDNKKSLSVKSVSSNLQDKQI